MLGKWTLVVVASQGRGANVTLFRKDEGQAASQSGTQQFRFGSIVLGQRGFLILFSYSHVS